MQDEMRDAGSFERPAAEAGAQGSAVGAQHPP